MWLQSHIFSLVGSSFSEFFHPEPYSQYPPHSNMCQYTMVRSSCSHTNLVETACKDPGSEFCGIQKTFASAKLVSQSDKACSKCEVKSDGANTAVKETSKSADKKVSEKGKAPKSLSFLPSKTDTSFSFAPPPTTPTRTQMSIEEKWKQLEDGIRWDGLLTPAEKLKQLEYHQVPPSPTKFRFKLG